MNRATLLSASLIIAAIVCRVAGAADRPATRADAGNGSDHTTVATGAAGGVNWPLRLNTAGKYLEDQSGTPYLLVADAGWELVTQLRQEDALAYLDDRLAKGFNAVEIRVIGRGFQSNAPNNYYDEPPFVNGPNDWSIRNEAYWSHVDSVLDAMRSRGMVVLMFPAYLGYGCGGEGWCQEMLAQTNAAMTDYGQWIGNRYKDYGNIIWMTGGDVHATGTALERNNAVVYGVRSSDADALFSAEPARGQIGGIDSYVGLVDINAVYAGDPAALVRAAYANGKPFMYQEGRYENEGGTSTIDVEAQALITYLGGGLVGHAFGSCPLWFFNNATTYCNLQSAPFNTWQNNLNSPGSIGVGNVGKLMRSRSWRSMVPDYANSAVLSPKNSDMFYRAAAREAGGETIMAWARDTSLVTVDMSKVRGPLARAWWYNPANGTSIDLGSFSASGTRSFVPPSAGLVLVLDDAALGLAAPGTTTYSFASDTVPPTAPTDLLATAVSASSVHLSWTASTDDRGVAGYRVFRDDQQIATVATTSYDDQGLQQQTQYSYTVSAFDGAQNVSGSSASATATTLTPDTTPPSVPTNLAAGTSVPGQISLTWNASTDDTGSVAGYVIRRNGVQLGTSSGTLYLDTGLVHSTTYTYSVAAFDATGNTSAYSPDVVATTPALPSGLVAAYSMNQSSGATLPDVSGRGNTGNLVNGPSWVAGKYGNALSFNGTNQRVDVGDSASLDLTTGMTLAAWVRPATVTSSWRDVIMKGADEYYLAGSSESGGAPAASGTFTSPLYGPVLVANTWTHLAATYDGATFRLFVNGVQVASRSQSGAIRSASGALGIGGDPFWGQYFSGAIDEIRIYNRALSPAEVQSDMNTAL